VRSTGWWFVIKSFNDERPTLHCRLGAQVGMQVPAVSQAKPMTIWCSYVVALVAIFLAASVALFYMPGQGPPLQKQRVPAAQSH